ncbi:MAG: NAD-dependent epimerase/dehydratase family protein [Actinobacteria bacterium]|nr:NAD-dependent epimerase/dehydratase family protein [Actinomycetota bacterium]
MKRVLVLGGGGFIGGHLVKRLVSQGHWVRSVDLNHHKYGANPQEFVQGDLTNLDFVSEVLGLTNTQEFDEIYQLAADMGGAGYIFSGDNDANVMNNSASINLNLLRSLTQENARNKHKRARIFYSSSACIYPEEKQLDSDNPGLSESDAYPANPDSEYGWEKLFSERLYAAYARNYGLHVRVARFHNIFGPEGTWDGGKEKAPAAICRKVAQAEDGEEIEIWGDGEQTRSFLFIDECLEAVAKLMDSEFSGPVNIGSEEMVTINQLVEMAASFEGKRLVVKHIPGPLGVRGRNSDNSLIKARLGWNYEKNLIEGLRVTYFWIKEQLQNKSASGFKTSLR